MVQAGGSESICDGAFPIATSVTIIGLMKRLYLFYLIGPPNEASRPRQTETVL